MASVYLALVSLVVLIASVQCQSRRGRGPDSRLRGSDPCAEKEMDIWFILDSSSSIYINDYRAQLQFTRDVVSRFDVRPRATKVGVLTFSDEIELPVQNLDLSRQKSDVINAINEDNLPYRTGITNTHEAIRFVREHDEFRRDITKVIVVITDGGSRSPGQTAREAELARDAGFYLFVIGVGQYLDEGEWGAIASDPDSQFIYNITNFRYLDVVKNQLPPAVCRLPPIILGGENCDVMQEVDLFFVAGPRGTQDAIQLIDRFVENGEDNRNQLRISYMIDACVDAENKPLADPGLYCDRFSPIYESTEDTYTSQMSRVVDVARANQFERRGVKQVAVLFVDDESMRLNRFGIVNDARNMAAIEDIEVVVVDLGVRGFANFVQGMASDRDNVVRFLSGPLLGQSDVMSQFMETVCNAMNRGSNDVPATARPPTTTNWDLPPV